MEMKLDFHVDEPAISESPLTGTHLATSEGLSSATAILVEGKGIDEKSNSQ